MNKKQTNEVVGNVARKMQDPTVRSVILHGLIDSKKEELADLEHEQWRHWTGYMLDNLTPENIEHWKRQTETSYEMLSEEEKASDREWADKVLNLLNMNGEEI